MVRLRRLQRTTFGLPGACNAAEVVRIWDASCDGAPSVEAWPRSYSQLYYEYTYWRALWDVQEAKAAAPDMKPELADWIKRGKAEACEEANYALDAELTNRKEAAEQLRYVRAYPLHAAVAANNLTAVTALLASGKIDIELEVAEYLVSKGADARTAVEPRSGYTLLHQAAMYRLTELVKALLKGGADRNAVYYAKFVRALKGDPQTPLMQEKQAGAAAGKPKQPQPAEQ
ncbi:hypothetical protein OEZ85_013399 [Tetradesmus obliquus]|uniref:Ankyrin repeat domain-containing protein n=1 Tax=Tetradesmus obliquus TaxID=3088 RepID=A0ABY8U6A8_TETOB|nr:hypothetical protein OEZ85_013399 [Tetradesmus obliquus]